MNGNPTTPKHILRGRLYAKQRELLEANQIAAKERRRERYAAGFPYIIPERPYKEYRPHKSLLLHPTSEQSLSPGYYPTITRDSQGGYRLTMAVIRRRFKAKPGQQLIGNNLNWILNNTRLEFENPKDPDNPLVLEGRELLNEALRNYAFKSKPIANFLEAESLLNNPLNRHDFPELRDENGEWREATADEICEFLGLPAEDFLNEVDAALRYFGVRKAELLVRLALPEVVIAAVESAKRTGKEGDGARKLIMEAAKLVETGPMVTVDQRKLTVNNNFPGQANGVPVWPSARVGQGILPAATLETSVDAELIEVAEETYA